MVWGWGWGWGMGGVGGWVGENYGNLVFAKISVFAKSLGFSEKSRCFGKVSVFGKVGWVGSGLVGAL